MLFSLWFFLLPTFVRLGVALILKKGIGSHPMPFTVCNQTYVSNKNQNKLMKKNSAIRI
jgi:hypothetical protein